MKVVKDEFRLVLIVLFVLCVGLAGVFFGAYPAAAHESPPSDEHEDDMPRASDVDRMDEASMKKFMEHLKIHFQGTTLTMDWIRPEDDFHYITIAAADNKIILHTKYRAQSQGASLPALKSIVDEARESGDVACEQDQGGNYFCAVLLADGRIVVSGFDHDLDDFDFSGLTCPYVNPGSGADKDKVAADEITNEDTPENREKLKGYVIGMEKHIIGRFQELIKENTEAGLNFQAAFVKAFGEITSLRPCWRIWPWKHGSIYVFMIQEGPDGRQTVIFNGNNPEFEGPDLFVKDEDGVDVGKLIADEVRDPDGDGFIEYKWDDPLNPDDGVDSGVRDEEGFRPAPGTSPKVSYVKKVHGFEGYIIGSGFYPRAESGDGGGCVVAGESSTPSGAAFNLFLAMFVLLSGIWLFSGRDLRERLRR